MLTFELLLKIRSSLFNFQGLLPSILALSLLFTFLKLF